MDKWVKELGTNRRSGWEFCEVSPGPKTTVNKSAEKVADTLPCFDVQAIRDIVHLIPDTPDFVYTVRRPSSRCAPVRTSANYLTVDSQTNDLGEITISHDERERLKHMGKTNQRASVDWQPEPYMSPDLAPRSSETAYLAVALSCPSDSPARRFHEDLISGKIAWDESKEEYALPANLGGFIRNASKAQDPCYNTEMRQSAGLFLQVRDLLWPALSSTLTSIWALYAVADPQLHHQGRRPRPRQQCEGLFHSLLVVLPLTCPKCLLLPQLTPIFSQSKVSTQVGLSLVCHSARDG